MKVLIPLCILIAMLSCNQQDEKPDYLWSEEKFTAVLTEVQLAEALVRLGYHRSGDSAYLKDSVYASAFNKMNVSRADFDSNYNFFANSPKEMEKVYQEVITNLSSRSAGLKARDSIALPVNTED